jgi:two-component system OmpR family response regulator
LVNASLPTTRASVLLVDDDELLAKGLARALRAAGHHVETAHTADEALRLATEFVPAVVVVDVVLPDGNGFSIARRLREKSRSLGVVLISGHEESELQAMGERPAHSEFLVKPFGHEALTHAVQKVSPGS